MSENTTVKNEDLVEVVTALFEGTDFVTPYQLIKVTNSLLGRELPTQMAYNYVRKGFIPTLTNEVGKKVIEVAVAIEWIVGYVERNA